MTATAPSPSPVSIWLSGMAASVIRVVPRYGLLVALVPFFFPWLVPLVTPDVTRFVAGLIAFIPLTALIEPATEELAEILGQFVGGLLHVVIGNASDVALTGMLLVTAATVRQPMREQMIEIVLYYIVGLILCNMLLFPGLASFLGSFRNGRMRFNAEQAASYVQMLGISIALLLLPSLAFKFATGVGSLPAAAQSLVTPTNLALLSDVMAVLLFVIYVLYIGLAVFQIGERPAQNRRRRAARRAMDDATDDLAISQLPDTIPDTAALFAEERAEAEARFYEASRASEPRAVRLQEKRRARAERGEQRYGRLHILRGLVAIAVLGLCAVVLILVAQGLASGVAHGVLSDLHLNPLFAGLIVFPVAINLAAAYGTVGMAWRNRMEIAFAVASGSVISWVLFSVPVLVLISHLVGLGALPLLFGFFLVVSLGIAFFLYFISALDGETTWLSGLQMMLFYAAVAVVVFVSSIVAQ